MTDNKQIVREALETKIQDCIDFAQQLEHAAVSAREDVKILTDRDAVIEMLKSMKSSPDVICADDYSKGYVDGMNVALDKVIKQLEEM